MKKIIFIGVLLSFTSVRAEAQLSYTHLSAFESLCINIEDVIIRSEVETAFAARGFTVIKWDKTLPKNCETGIIELFLDSVPKVPNSEDCGTIGIRIRECNNQIFAEIYSIDVKAWDCSDPEQCCYYNYGYYIEKFLEEENIYYESGFWNKIHNYELFKQYSSNRSAQVPCADFKKWTEKDFINAEFTWRFFDEDDPVVIKLLEDGRILYNGFHWDRPGNWIFKGNSLNFLNLIIEPEESMTGKIGIWPRPRDTSQIFRTFIIEEFKFPFQVKDDAFKTIKCLVERKINKWQQKGEFEKLADFQARVSENNRNQKIREYQKDVIDSLKTYQKDYWRQAGDVTIGRYDTENETFLMHHPEGDFILPVPIDLAPKFKEEYTLQNQRIEKLYSVLKREGFVKNSMVNFIANFHNQKFKNKVYEFVTQERLYTKSRDEFEVKYSTHWVTNYNPEFILSKNQFVLSSLTFYNKTNGLTFQYDIGDSKKYSTTEIDYSFAEIQLPELNSSTKTPTQIGSNSIKVGSSVVDLNIPTNSKVDNRYAIVIGNEDYQSYQRSLNAEQNVDYAVHDAKVFKEYCLKTLGVKEVNMNFLINGTAGSMNQKINKVLKLMEKLGSEGELVIYYAGHGFPDEQTKEPYLIPVDVSGTDLSYAVKLHDLYKKLGNTGAKITVFLDACFTGSGRNAGLVAARGVRVKPKQEILNGNVVVFSASSGEQSALPYHQEGHGLFTYYLLEKLQESEGDISYGDLADYINSKVSVTSINVNEKEQDPVVNTSEKVADSWRNWSF